jgi:hypothetical protein
MCGLFPAATSEALMNPDTAANLKAVTIKLDVANAAELWMSMHIKHEQWDDMAKALNSRMPSGQKNHWGCVAMHQHNNCFAEEVWFQVASLRCGSRHSC